MSEAVRLTCTVAFALVVSVFALWALGCEGRVAGFEIGPKRCVLGVQITRKIEGHQ